MTTTFYHLLEHPQCSMCAVVCVQSVRYTQGVIIVWTVLLCVLPTGYFRALAGPREAVPSACPCKPLSVGVWVTVGLHLQYTQQRPRVGFK